MRKRSARSKRILDAGSNVATATTTMGRSSGARRGARGVIDAMIINAKAVASRCASCRVVAVAAAAAAGHNGRFSPTSRDAGEWVFERQKSESRDA